VPSGRPHWYYQNVPVVLTTQAFRYELAPTQAQVRVLRFYCWAYRRSYNLYVAARRNWWESNKDSPIDLRAPEPCANSLAVEFTARKRANKTVAVALQDPEITQLALAPRQLVDWARGVAENAYVRWFQRLKAWRLDPKPRKRPKAPAFKSFNNPDDMCCAMQTQSFKATDRAVFIPKLGFVAVKESTAKLQGRPVRLNLSEHAGRWYISVCCLEVPREVPDRTDTERVGVDLGVRKLATLSTGEFITESPEILAGMTRTEKRAKRLQRSLSRKQEEARRLGTWDKYATSKGYQRVRRKLQTAGARGANQRLDRSHKVSTRLAKEFRTIAVEDLDVQSMLRSAKGTAETPGKNVRQKAGLNRAVASKCFGAVRAQLEYKAKWYGATVETVPRFYPSSKTCSACGNVKQDLGSKETYHCDACGLTIDRDLNAAINIRDFSPEAQEKLSQGCEGERVDCPKRASGSRAGQKGRKTTKPEKHVQDPQGKPDAGCGQHMIFSAGQSPRRGDSAPATNGQCPQESQVPESPQDAREPPSCR